MSQIKSVVKISELRHGDTVEVGNNLETVDKKNIKHCTLFGHTYKGSPFFHGITKVVFRVPIVGGMFRYE